LHKVQNILEEEEEEEEEEEGEEESETFLHDKKFSPMR